MIPLPYFEPPVPVSLPVIESDRISQLMIFLQLIHEIHQRSSASRHSHLDQRPRRCPYVPFEGLSDPNETDNHLIPAARWRNRLITSLATLGSILASTFLILPTSLHASLYAASAVVVVSSVCMSDSYVCLNAMLPELAARREEEVREDSADEEEQALLDGMGRGSLEIVDLPAPPTSPAPRSTAKTSALGHISSRGIAIGFGAGVSALTISLIPISISGGSLRAMQSVIGASGVIWATLTGVMWWLLPAVPKADGERGVVVRKVKEGWRRVGALVDGEEVRRLRVTYWYLLASALLQDGTRCFLPVPPPLCLLLLLSSIQHHTRRLNPLRQDITRHVSLQGYPRRPPNAAHRRRLINLDACYSASVSLRRDTEHPGMHRDGLDDVRVGTGWVGEPVVRVALERGDVRLCRMVWTGKFLRRKYGNLANTVFTAVWTV